MAAIIRGLWNRRNICNLFVLIASLAPSALYAQTIKRNWNANPAILQSDSRTDIFVVGDVHGDFDRLVNALASAGVIKSVVHTPNDAVWNARNASLVLLGDLIDKGTQALAVIEFARSLAKSAQARGGKVVVLMGNHEAEFLADPTGKKATEFREELRKAGLSPSNVAKCAGVGEYLCGLPLAARISDWFFSHAGNTDGKTLADVSKDIEIGFAQNGFAADSIIGDHSLLEARLAKNEGDYSWLNPDSHSSSEEELLRRYTSRLGVRHIVQGHQPGSVLFPDGTHRKRGRAFQRFGLLFLADVGMSRAIDDSTGVVLRIEQVPVEKVTAICPDRQIVTLWSAASDKPFKAPAACGSEKFLQR